MAKLNLTLHGNVINFRDVQMLIFLSVKWLRHLVAIYKTKYFCHHLQVVVREKAIPQRKPQKLSKTPKPNKAKSYLTGSLASIDRSAVSNSANALASSILRVSKPSFLDTLPECASNGQDSMTSE